MPTKIGHFEILSELSKSPTSAVYKANDPESGQTVALKAIALRAFGDHASELEKALIDESEKTKALSSSNITSVFGAGVIEGQFCAAMEYVQGNSIATMLARKEGFSIWDLLDIGRQLCNGLDHAASHNIVHYSLEPAKIMCGWDGTVKILSFGVSSVGNFAHLVSEGLPVALHYTSPEQVQGQPLDGRSNLFTLGAMFYEMVTERKAFDRDDIESLRQSIVEATPVPPLHVNPKVHPHLSDLIMKALSKDPAERYANGRALLDELEKCKESKTTAPKKAAPAPSKGLSISDTAKLRAQSKFVSPGSKAAAPTAPKTLATAKPASPSASARSTPQQAWETPSKPSASALPRPSTLASPVRPTEQKSATPKPAGQKTSSVADPATASPAKPSALAKPASTLARPKAAAAAAAATGPSVSSSAVSSSGTHSETPELDLSDSFISASVNATMRAAESHAAHMSAAVVDEPEVETFEPQSGATGSKIAIDPLMAEGGSEPSAGTSFSDIAELPPLKEVYVEQVPPPRFEDSASASPVVSTVFSGGLKSKKDEKLKVQPREVAEKAIKEIKGVPPKLFAYALGGAVGLILAIGIGITVYIHSQNDDSAPSKAETTAETPAQPAATTPARLKSTKPAAPAAEPVEGSEPETAAQPATPANAAPANKAHTAKKKPAAPAIVPGQMAIDSTPQGAQVQVDGRSDPSYITPFALSNLDPGPHTIVTSKPGYSSDSRTVNVTSGNRAAVQVRLVQLMATLSVNSTPGGANVYVDGRDSGVKTPGQISLSKGAHVVLVRKMGYLDETMNGQFVPGQTTSFAPVLRSLGNADDIKVVGKISKLFGGGKSQPGQATVSIRTQPKGAQVAINQRIMDKNSPLDVALDPGNYVIDITLTGYAPIHKVITADKGGKVAVDETLQPQ